MAQDEDGSLDADGWLAYLLGLAKALAATPRDRELSKEEFNELLVAAINLGNAVLTLDLNLRNGFVPPRAWTKAAHLPGEVPTSELHATLKQESDALVQQILEILGKHTTPKTGIRVTQLFSKLLQVLALFTSESVRLAVLNNVKPEPAPGKPALTIIKSE
jgi:hypothetical protein